jgi:hypothetical protein
MPFVPRRQSEPVRSAKPLRMGLRPLLGAAFSGVILVALSGAFLVGLAVIGVMAGAAGSFGLMHRYLRRHVRLVAFHHPVVG